MSNQRETQKLKLGFTLLELLLVFALIALLAGISVPVLQSLQVRNNLDIATNTVFQNLRRAQTLSQAVERDNRWGVMIDTEKIVIFKGESYLSRDAGFDESFNMPQGVTISISQEIIFLKLSGELQASKQITLLSNSGDSKEITINEKGTILY